MRRWVALTDALSVTAALLVAHVLRFGLLPDSGYLVWVGVIASVTVATFALLGLYRDRSVEPLPELGRVALATTLLPLGVLLVVFLTDVYLSRTWIALSWIIATGLVVLSRTAWRFAASPGQHDTTAGQT
jgi:FlaA1/EpsC-like NDP-sugar epimerase